LSGAKEPSRRAGFAGRLYSSTTRTTWKVVLQRFRPAEPALLLYYKDDLESRPTGLRGAGRTATAIANSSRGTSPINRDTDAWIIISPPILGRSKDPRFRRRIILRTGWNAAGAG
jgi:hypothetical protein